MKVAMTTTPLVAIDAAILNLVDALLRVSVRLLMLVPGDKGEDRGLSAHPQPIDAAAPRALR